MRKSKVVRVALLFAATMVWGTAVYRVQESMTANSEPDDSLFTENVSLRRAHGFYVYVADVRDPFQLIEPVVPVPKRTIPDAGLWMWTPPPFGLSGIVVTGTRRVAVLGNANGDAFFVSEGDSLNGVFIKKIEKDSVSYLYGGKKKSWGVR